MHQFHLLLTPVLQTIKIKNKIRNHKIRIKMWQFLKALTKVRSKAKNVLQLSECDVSSNKGDLIN